MRDLVDSLALSSKALLRHQEDVLAVAGNTRGFGKGALGKGRGRTVSGGREGGGSGGNSGGGTKGSALRKGFSGNDNGRRRRMSRGKSVGIWNLGVIN